MPVPVADAYMHTGGRKIIVRHHHYLVPCRAAALDLHPAPLSPLPGWDSHLAITRISCYHVDVIQSFKNAGTGDIFNGENTKEARKICPSSLWKIAARKLDQIDSVTALHELKIPPGNKLEVLSGGRTGQHSIRINDQYRICFAWTDLGPDQVEIVDYHS